MDKYFFRLILICVFISSSSCKKFKNDLLAEWELTREESLAAIDEAIQKIEFGAITVDAALDDLNKSLGNNIQDALTFNVPYLIDWTVGAVGVEFRCNTDFIANRTLFFLRMMKAELLNDEPPLPPPPSICQSSINKVDLNAPIGTRNVITVWGYDFIHQDSFSAQFVSGSFVDELPSTAILFQSEFEFTIDISDLSDNYISQFDYFTVKYGENQIFAASIIQENIPPPEVKTVYITPSSIGWIPPHVPPGDREFGGSANCYSEVRFFNSRTQAYLYVWFGAVETKPDWTLCKGWSPAHYFYTAPTGWHIKRIDGEKNFPNLVSYIDYDKYEDTFNTTLGLATVMGDGPGNDAGVHTGVDYNFNYAVPIVIEEDY